MKKIVSLIFLLIPIAIFSCRESKEIFTYTQSIQACDTCEFQNPYTIFRWRKSLIFENDSLLKFSAMLHDVGAVADIKYFRTDNFIFIDSHSVSSKKYLQDFPQNIYGHVLVDYKDSIVDKETLETYVSKKHIDSIIKSYKKVVYVIIDNKKIRISKRNSMNIHQLKLLKNLDVKILDKKIAQDRFNINSRYDTYIINQIVNTNSIK